jgi:hypothetical protein
MGWNRQYRKNISYYCDVFSELVIDKVGDSAWVNGVKKFLIENSYNREFNLITATPQDEIDVILSRMNCSNVFITAYVFQ